VSEHAVLAPSSAPQWAVCSGSVAAQLSAPNIETQASREGTAAHWVGSECLTQWRTPNTYKLHCVDWLGEVAPNGVVIDDKMVEGAQVYVDDVLQVAQKYGALQRMLVEHRVRMKQVHPELNWGTLDLALPILEHGIVYLWDYKHGHREVSAKGNFQMIDYLQGIIEEYKIVDMSVQFVIRVVQPFAYHANGQVDEWCGTLADLQQYVAQLTHQAHAALTNPTMTAGKHCRDCSAVGACAVGRKYMHAFADYINEPYAIDNMSSADLAVERGVLKDCLAVGKSRAGAIEDELEHRIKKGDSTTGLALGTKLGAPKWSIPPKQVIALCAQFGADVGKIDALTPTQAKAKMGLAARIQFEQTLPAVTKRSAGALKLIPAEDSITSRAFRSKK
jgi:hypothetical protein